MTINLNDYTPGDWLRLREGGLWRPAGVRRCSGLYCWELDDYSYTSDGTYYTGTKSARDIVEIIPQERITLLEWITDRRPSSSDATDNCVLVKQEENDIQLWHWNPASRGDKPWAHCPGWTPPKKVNPIRDCIFVGHGELKNVSMGYIPDKAEPATSYADRIAQLEKQVAGLEAGLNTVVESIRRFMRDCVLKP